MEHHDAPEGVIFDTYEETLARGGLALVLADLGTMPPQGGVTDDDNTKLEYWLICHEGL